MVDIGKHFGVKCYHLRIDLQRAGVENKKVFNYKYFRMMLLSKVCSCC